LNTKGWNADQDKLFEAGDYLEVNGELKMVPEDVAAPQSYIEYTGTNYMPSPFDPSGWKPDSDGTITNVTLANPSGSSVIGLAEQTGAGPFTFFSSLDNPQDFLAGDKLYCAFIYKRVDTWEAGCFIGFNKTGSQIASARIDLRNNTYPNGNVDEVKFTELGNDFVLVEAMETLTIDAAGCFAVATFTDMVNAPTQPPIGSQLYVQAAYFGKSDKYKGAISYTSTNLMPSPFDPSGWTDGGNGTVDNVTLDNPSGEPVLGLAVQDGASFFTMQDSFLNDLSVVTGEKLYIGIILKPVDANPFDISIVIGGSVTPIKTLKIAVEDLSVRSSNMTDYQITDLGNGFKLFQAYWIAEADDPDTYGRYTFTASNAGTVAPIGSQVYAQASYFGKADDYPAVIDPAEPNQYPADLLATADIPIAPPLRKSLTGGESIITNEPKGKFYLGSNDQSWDINVNGVQSMGFDFIEDVN